MPTMSTKPEPDVAMEGEEECCFPCWKTLPDALLLHVFSYLKAPHLYEVGLVCKAWLRVAFDELLWKDLFYRYWQISRSIPMAPGKYSWIQEYKRLLYHTPAVESEVLKQHADQVLHVNFSHNGKMFATCSKDGFIRVWDATYPTSIKYKADMRKFTWKYTQFSQFNSTDTLLLVSGVHFGSLSTSGEIAVFSLDGDFVMQSRVTNKPYDVFGTWYNDCYLLSGNLHWIGHLNSSSVIWLNKAYQETCSEEESVVMRLFKFSNINASSIRTIMVANCLNHEEEVSQTSEMQSDVGSSNQSDGSIMPLEEETANQMADDITDGEDDQCTDATECNTGVEKKKKTAKSVQSIQVYENGSFITKFVELDEDEPNNKLNGTIKYSNDYRMAEEPGLDSGKVHHSDTSGSDMSDKNGIANMSFSDHSEKSNSSNVDMVDGAAGCIEMEFGKGCATEMEESQNLVAVDSNCCDTSLSNVCIEQEGPVMVVEQDTSSPDLESMVSQFSVDAGDPEEEDPSKSPLEGKPLMQEQQLHNNEIEQSSSSLHSEYDLEPSSSTRSKVPVSSEELDELERNAKVSFCCVGYKKQKKNMPPSVSDSQEDFGVSAGASSCTKSVVCSDSNTNSCLVTQLGSDVNVACLPVKPKCNTQLETDVQASFSSNEQVKEGTRGPEQPKFCLTASCSKKQKKKKVCDKYLIFTKGSKTYTPHQIGIKRIKPMKAFNADGTRLLPNVAVNTHNFNPEHLDDYDDVDHLIDMHGHIIGMALSPDHRYLYVNSRPWPKDYHIENPLYPPPIAQEIDIHVIDLLNMREVGTMHRSHKAYTSNDECFFIFLDVCDEYVASGAEDKYGYLWDRHYGLCLHKYPHSDVVNSIAFNPGDPEVLVTVSDDFSIKIWRSQSREKEVVKAFNKEHCIRLKHVQDIMSDADSYMDDSGQATAADKT